MKTLFIIGVDESGMTKIAGLTESGKERYDADEFQDDSIWGEWKEIDPSDIQHEITKGE